MKKIYLNEDTSINWFTKYGVYALDVLDMTTKKFEKSSDICADDNLVINIIDDINNRVAEEDNISKQIQQIEFESYNRIEFLLYYNNILVGYVEKIDGFGL